MPGRVEGRVALVTGGAMGLGKADCERLAAEGATVIVTDREHDLAQKVAEEIGGEAMALDVTSESQWKVVMDAVQERHGGLDILVNNAGNVIFENVEACSLDNFKLHLDIHVAGTFLGCKYAIPIMKHRHKANGGGGSSIINMASAAGSVGYANVTAYSAAKGAISAMTRSVAMHCQDEKYGIRCNALAPGGIETPMVMGASGRAGQKPIAIPKGPLPKEMLGDPRDVAGSVVFLASDDARFFNGATIPVDNGLSVRAPS